MAVDIDPNWKSLTLDHSRVTVQDKQLVELLSEQSMIEATRCVANHLVANATADPFLQEFANRALTDIGFNLSVIKGLHQAEDSSVYLPTTHFDLQATGVRRPHRGTDKLIYHVYVTTGAAKGKGGTILISQITYKEGGNVTALKLRDIPLAVKWQ